MQRRKCIVPVYMLMLLLINLACNSTDEESNVVDPGTIPAIEVVGVPVIYETGMTLDVDDVGALAVLHGLHYEGFNFVRHNLVDQTQYVIENWPGTLVTSHAGADMITGETLTSTTPENNPVRKSYELEWGVGPNRGRSS